MTCPRCQRDNPPEMKFCGECGTRLAAACPACGTPHAPGQKFCGQCGTPLAAGAAAPRAPEAYTPPHLAERIRVSREALAGERKQVTVLFADMKGSMELLADRDPEEARKLLDPVIEAMMDAVHRYEGTVNQVMGDGIMALFGAPLALEDHAVRACYAALALQERLAQYAEELHRTEGVPIQIRVGVNSGEVVVRSIGSDLRMDYTAVGQTTHVAARLEQMAMPGSVLIAPATLALAEGYVTVQPLGPRPIKGLDAPMDVYALVGAAAVRSRFQPVAARGLTRFVGRDPELEQLRQALEQAGAGQGQVVAVVGEPGVGKSRLYWQFNRSHLTEGWSVIEGGSVSYGKATAYLPVIELLRAYFEIEPRDDARKVQEKVTGKLFALDRRLEPALPALLWLLDAPLDDPEWERLDPPQRRQRTLDAVKRLLLRRSQAQPLIVVLEDLHWIDDETQALLDGLVEGLPAMRLLLLVNYRPEYRHGWSGRACYRQLRVDPLPPESADALLEALLGADGALAPLKRLLAERTEGNPFFLEETVRALVETGALAGERGAYRLTRPLAGVQVPATVQALLAARIDRLSAEDKRLLQSAAVVGHEVPFAILQALGDPAEDELRRGLARLQVGELLYEVNLFPDLSYTFKHALTHEVAYQSLLQATRQQQHARIGAVLEERFGAIVDAHPERLARHWTEAGRPEQAIDYWWKAGTKAVERSANVDAVAHLTQGLALLESLPDTPERDRRELDFQTALGPALMVTSRGGYAAPEVERAYKRAHALCEQLGGAFAVGPVLLSLFPVHLGLRVIHLIKGQHLVAQEHAEQVLLLAEASRDPELLVEANRAMGETLHYLGQPADARGHLERAIQLDGSLQHRSRPFRAGHTVGHSGVFAGAHLASTLWMLGWPDAAVRAANAALALAREVSDFPSIAFALHGCIKVHLHRRDAPAVDAQAAALVALTREQRFPYWQLVGETFGAWARAEQGAAGEHVRAFRDGIDGIIGMGTSVGMPMMLVCLAGLHETAGSADAGLAALDEAATLSARGAERDWEAELHRVRGELLLRRSGAAGGDVEACFRRALDVARRLKAKGWELRAATSLARLLVARGQRDEARRTLEPVHGWFTEGFDTADLRAAKAVLEEIARGGTP